MDPTQALEQQLQIAQAVLDVLERQAAGHTSLTIPAPLQVQLDDKRNEVASLQRRLAQRAGRAEGVRDNLPRPDAIFVGRDEEKQRCLQALSAGRPWLGRGD